MKKVPSSLYRLVNILSQNHCMNGAVLTKVLKTTPTAIRQMVQLLKSYGIQIYGVKGKGYTLLEPLVLLDPLLIQQGIVHSKVTLEVLETIGSTNDYVKTLVQSKKITTPHICLAEMQLSGKGRLSKTWYSPFGRNIYLSCFYPFPKKRIHDLSGLSLVVSLATLHTLKNYGENLPFYTKWPNDIIYQNKKISGNLIEVQTDATGGCQAIIGIGINLNMSDEEQAMISQPSISLGSIVKQYIDRNTFASLLIHHLFKYLEKFESFGFSSFQNEWNKFDYFTQKTITLHNLDKAITGTVVGVNEFGQLILLDEHKKQMVFSTGEMSILKEHEIL